MKNFTFSNRIRKLAEIAGPCNTMADIGTDHALLPIFMLKEGLCKKAIACDISESPLAKAALDVSEAEIDSALVDLRLGNGLERLQPGECDTIVIAGMGGLLIADILENGKKIFKKPCRLIMQPNTCRPELRTYLAENGFEISDESACEDEGHTYLFITAKYTGVKRTIDFKESVLGTKLQDKPEDFKIYCAELKEKYERKLDGLRMSQQDVSEEIQKAELILKEVRL